MANTIHIKKGLDIKISGKAIKSISKIAPSEIFEIIPDYFHGIIPKMLVKGGEKVEVGTPLFYNKNIETMKFVSPVSGTVQEVVRGERRKVMKVVVKTDQVQQFRQFDVEDATKKTADEIKSLLLESGLWVYIKQRPYDVIANPEKTPKAVFISTFSSAPLAPDYEFVLKDKMSDFQKGVDVLGKLSAGGVHLGLKSDNSIFSEIKNAEKTIFKGKHPAGNVGIQINHTSPINKGETVWTIEPQDVVMIGRFFQTGKVDVTRTIALTGPEVEKPQYFETLSGNNIADMVKGNLKNVSYPLRFISGDVLTGTQIAENGYLTPYHSQISVIDEGNETHELFGWMMPRLNKFSAGNLFLTKLMPNKEFKYDARLLGGPRGIIMSNEYDKVFPMDIYAEYLIKAMLASNIDKMERYGAYEVAPEDFALCEFVDTSKLPLQHIVRTALDALQKEVE